MESSTSISLRLLLLLICTGSGTAMAAPETSGAAAQDQQTLAGGNSYLIEVPVVSTTPIEVTRVVERPEKTCRRLDREDYRASHGHEAWQPYPAGRDYGRRSYRGDSYDRGYSADYRRGRGGVGAQILGGLIGGVVGNQFGGGSGKKALTIAGALIGSSVARGPRTNRSRYEGHDQYPEIQPEYECHTSTRLRQITEISGFEVTYSYNNALHKRRMTHDPGDTLELRVRAVPDLAPEVL